MRFLLDEDVHPTLAEIARGRGHDVVSVHAIGRTGLSDREQLAFAARDGRILITRNRDDFIQLTVEYFQTGTEHSGILIVPYSLPNHRPRRIAEALDRWIRDRSGRPAPRLFIDFLG